MTLLSPVPMQAPSAASTSSQVMRPPEKTQPGPAPCQPEEVTPATKDRGRSTARTKETDSEDVWPGTVTDACGAEWPTDIFRKRDPPPRPEPGDEKWVVFIVNYPRQRVLENKAFTDMVDQMECDLNIVEEDVPKWHPQLVGKWTIAAIPHHIFRPPYSNECGKDLWDYVIKRLKLEGAEGLMYYTQREWNGFIGGDVDWPD